MIICLYFIYLKFFQFHFVGKKMYMKLNKHLVIVRTGEDFKQDINFDKILNMGGNI